jgi:rRNA maturation RNase YbeY
MIRFTAIDLAMPDIDMGRVRLWIEQVVDAEGYRVGELYYYFCSDDALLRINQERLGHDFYTDIVTFPLVEEGLFISSEFCISLDRVADNAQSFGRCYESELHRVIIHGVLHLIGFDDHTDEDRLRMRDKEEECLKLLFK